MGALWTENDTPEKRGALAGIISELVRAIDLRRLSPYHPAAPEQRRRSEAARDDATRRAAAARSGLWVPEEGRLRQTGAERVRRWLRFILHTDDTPSRAALAFAVGVFIAWTPVLGLHTLIGLGIAFLFGLNRVAVVAGTFVNNPWTIVPIYTSSAAIGSFLTGSEAGVPTLRGLTSWEGVGEFFGQVRPWVVPMTTGTVVLGAACALVSFPLVLYGIRWYRSLRQAG